MATKKQVERFLQSFPPETRFTSRIEQGFCAPGQVEFFYLNGELVLVLDTKTNFPRCRATIYKPASK